MAVDLEFFSFFSLAISFPSLFRFETSLPTNSLSAQAMANLLNLSSAKNN